VISVEEAARRIAGAFVSLEPEIVRLAQARDRVLARDAIASLDQPPAAVSAMDGYAVRAVDVKDIPVRLRIIGSAPAGYPFAGSVCDGEAIRIFTGGVVPDGADAVVTQENTVAEGAYVTLKAPATTNHIRPRGLDFRKGALLAPVGRRLTARDIALLACGDIAEVEVYRNPRIAFATNGDELSRPGEPRKPGGIVASSGYGLSNLIEKWGGIAHDIGILPDTIEALEQIPNKAAGADLIVTLGGASVGDHDLVQRALAPKGFALDFWKVAMRPGKPLIFGRLGATPFLGLPGNPVSALVCAFLFIKPAVAAMLGLAPDEPLQPARLKGSLGPNDSRQDYLRARVFHRGGELWAEPFAVQDSSMLSVFAAADALIVRPPDAAAVQHGDSVSLLLLDDASALHLGR